MTVLCISYDMTVFQWSRLSNVYKSANGLVKSLRHYWVMFHGKKEK